MTVFLAVFLNACVDQTSKQDSHNLDDSPSKQVIYNRVLSEYGVRLDEERLTAFDGTVYEKNNWSELKKDLMRDIRNEKFVDHILVNFNKLDLDHADQLSLKSFMINHAVTLGDDDLPRLTKFLAPYLPMNRKLIGFFKSIASFEQEEAVPLEEKETYLVIGTTGYGGGHHAVAKAIYTELKSFPNANVILIDTKELEAEKNPMLMVTGSLHEESIYDEVFQKENNPEKADALWSFYTDVLQREFIANNENLALARKIQEIRPTKVFAVTHHRPWYISISSLLKVPFYFVATDFEIQSYFSDSIDLLNPSYGKFLAATKSPIFFKPLLGKQQAGRDNLRALSNYVVRYSNSYWDWDKFNSAAKVFDVLGIPVREEIRNKQEDTEYLAKSMSALGINADDRVVTIAMGKQGAGTLHEIVKEISANHNKFTLREKIHFFVLCGKNQILLGKLKDELKNFESDAIQIHPMGLLNGAEINSLYNVSDFVLSKPGGATTAELARLGVPLLAYSYYSWEKANLDYLASLGLANDISGTNELIRNIENALVDGFSKKEYQEEDWKWNLRRILQAQ